MVAAIDFVTSVGLMTRSKYQRVCRMLIFFAVESAYSDPGRRDHCRALLLLSGAGCVHTHGCSGSS
mgnify:FL=1